MQRAQDGSLSMCRAECCSLVSSKAFGGLTGAKGGVTLPFSALLPLSVEVLEEDPDAFEVLPSTLRALQTELAEHSCDETLAPSVPCDWPLALWP